MADEIADPGIAGFWHNLHAEHRGPLMRYVRRLVPDDPHRAEDIVQETLLRAWLAAPTLVDQGAAGSPRAWLFTVARNLVVDTRRRAAARPREVEEELAPHHVDPSAPVDEQVLDAVVLARALRLLTDAHREILVRFYCLDHSGPRIAADLGIPPGTVKSRTHHATRALRGALLRTGIDEC
ncbi:sigma-70 family RNA polymerase sigma factor [Actinospica sp. MGRD01-02]|uniref:Sigma-70 family RNA polymerase sigma factor n=1 Tax=Actinospica acidithermotolerans TaxID=2828514 RepID=A0A941EAK4_9ACTN|nr:sigma-70 family RNA polymerase sigma factor [Actinospica acidithermotolerans]MBR7826953.1 sigma-70 family RNA polymerase sigma factor [Actinospica acidithermotolerans]